MSDAKLLALVVLALASGMSFAGAATAQVPSEDSVSGAGSTPFGFFVEIDAHSGPSGENAYGTLAITAPFSQPSEFGVVCLRVTGNTAVFGANSQGPEPRSGLFRVVDGSPDTLEADHLDGPAGPDDCAKPFTADEGPTVPSSGDFVVTDAQPFPTSKDQCRNGGWRNFGSTFKNQGQCVALRRNGASSPPPSRRLRRGGILGGRCRAATR